MPGFVSTLFFSKNLIKKECVRMELRKKHRKKGDKIVDELYCEKLWSFQK